LSQDVLLLLLRLGASTVLMGFVGTIGAILWRDFRQTSKAAARQSAFRQGRLVVMESGLPEVELGQDWVLKPVTRLGRSSTNTVVLAEPFASNEHALVTWRDGQWWLEDLNSSNGTLLNGVKIQEPTVLSSGDLIGFGRVMLRLEID
jgi:pSer/pThr/pTyr-binding forkhead associated (FHA) protein